MKTILVTLAIAFALAALVLAQSPPTVSYTVHEWGTFTSVQGGDGKLLAWRPLQTSQLPGFVHDWQKPGLPLSPLALRPGGKGGLVTLQRLETPVVYFYSEKTMNADVEVVFPRGFVTEWYPQPSQVGSASSYLPASLHLHQSQIRWRHLTLVPPGPAGPRMPALLPKNEPGRNYFAARETDADYVQTDMSALFGGTNETEKFLFYRGAGSFETPLHVAMDESGRIAVGNTGIDRLSHLFIVRIQDGFGAFAALETLLPGETNWQDTGDSPANIQWQRFPLAQFHNVIATQMAAALASEGLFDKEARAMVNTWRDSWFTEEGTRVLYVLPRAWTDDILPMTLNPRPAQLVRVMVGRAEIIPPEVPTDLLTTLTHAQKGDANAVNQAKEEMRKLGRFAWPALDLAMGNQYTNAVAQLGYQLMFEAAQLRN